MKATCAWGDGPDVVVGLSGSTMILHESPNDRQTWEHGTVSEGSMDLTAAEAEDLGIELITAAKQARDLNRLTQERDGAVKELTEWWKDVLANRMCDGLRCKGGTGPHTRDECPW